MTEAPTFALDHAATTTLRPGARTAVIEAWDAGLGNASGTHGSARRAKNLIEEARERAAELLGLRRPLDVIFTSGGTESDNLAVRGVAASGSGSIVVSSIEHKAVLEAARACRTQDRTVREIRPDGNGVVRPDSVAAAVDEETCLVSVMMANNEVGTVQPIRAIAEAARNAAPDVMIHTDAVQAFVGGPVDVAGLGVDLVTVSAHKFGGPQGVGILGVTSSVALEPIVFGGGHEGGRRPGTSNVAGIVGMVAAMEETADDRRRFGEVVGAERDSFERVLSNRIPSVTITGSRVERVPHISHVRFPDVAAETLLIHLDRAGIHASGGSSCSSGAVEPSHVLSAMGIPGEEAKRAVRFSFGWDTPTGSGERAAHAIAEVVDAVVAR